MILLAAKSVSPTGMLLASRAIFNGAFFKQFVVATLGSTVLAERSGSIRESPCRRCRWERHRRPGNQQARLAPGHLTGASTLKSKNANPSQA